MGGFKLYISNTSNTPPSVSDLCYQDPPSTPYPDIIQTFSCNSLGQYVIYYDDVPGPRERGSFIELCYVFINNKIATNALLSQNPIGTKSDKLAEDGDKTTCSKTKGTDVWFQVDMTEIRIVTELYLTGEDIVFELQKLQKRTSAEDSVCTNLISGIILKINRRNKLIRIADKSPAGWYTVREYESDDLASDSEDEKRLRQAESRALKTIEEKKTRGKPYSKPSATVSRPANSTDTSNSYFQPYSSTQQLFPSVATQKTGTKRLILDLSELNFYVQKNKCLEWLGLIWNSKHFTLKVPERRINDTKDSLRIILKSFSNLNARMLAQFVGRIISMSPVMGNVTNLMTRHIYFAIENRKSWNTKLYIVYEQCVLAELKFWHENLLALNEKCLLNDSLPRIIVYSDASNVALGAYTVESNEKIFHCILNENEKKLSSTWRELRAIQFSFEPDLKCKIVKWHTDNQNCVNIINKGSRKYLTYVPAIKTALIELDICEIGIVACPSTQYGPLCKKEHVQQNVLDHVTLIQDDAFLAVQMDGLVKNVIRRQQKLTKDKYSDQSKSSRKTTFNRNRGSNNVHEYVNAAITSVTEDVTVHLENTTEETELHKTIPILSTRYTLKI
ncbi:unnamed protein product [Mytilus coruscus]|uniref:Uncharacterized protein n=1 Tax=Mytilus coruscus TaxID=42192 RepID=A0A6J8EPV4_MYTCO|nr:unnamed protein product [Mytilus coruscus]